jgi:hypothetical protein
MKQIWIRALESIKKSVITMEIIPKNCLCGAIFFVKQCAKNIEATLE